MAPSWVSCPSWLRPPHQLLQPRSLRWLTHVRAYILYYQDYLAFLCQKNKYDFEWHLDILKTYLTITIIILSTTCNNVFMLFIFLHYWSAWFNQTSWWLESLLNVQYNSFWTVESVMVQVQDRISVSTAIQDNLSDPPVTLIIQSGDLVPKPNNKKRRKRRRKRDVGDDILGSQLDEGCHYGERIWKTFDTLSNILFVQAVLHFVLILVSLDDTNPQYNIYSLYIQLYVHALSWWLPVRCRKWI